MFQLYGKDLSRGRLRDTERTEMVLVSWLQRVAPYAYERMPIRKNDRAINAYFAITAERVFFRKQVYTDCDVPSEFLRDRRLLATAPFGRGTATLAELLRDNVRAAMAYVPLAPAEGGRTRQPILARLYCVSGLRQHWTHPFVERGPVGSERYSWFLSGVDTAEKTIGQSWYLAASLLMRCLESGAQVDVKKKLARDFIITGSVDGSGHVDRVLLDAKLALAEVPEFERLTWIVPAQQKDEVVGIRATPIATDALAYERVLNGMDRATRNLFDLVNGGTPATNVSSIYSVLQDGADANLLNEKGWCVRQIIMSNITRKIVNLIRTPHLAEKPTIEIQNEIRRQLAPEWDAEKASSYYGNDPLLFFLAARAKNHAMMQVLKATMNINGVDRDGETALDFAIDAKDRETESFLREHGADKRGKYDIHSKHMRAFLRDPEGELERDRMYIAEALNHRLDPFRLTSIGRELDGSPIVVTRTCWDNLAELESAEPDPWNEEPWVEISYMQTSVFLEAILKRNWGIVQMCLDVTVKPLPEIEVTVVGSQRKLTTYIEVARRFSMPVIVRAITDYMKAHPSTRSR